MELCAEDVTIVLFRREKVYFVRRQKDDGMSPCSSELCWQVLLTVGGTGAKLEEKYLCNIIFKPIRSIVLTSMKKLVHVIYGCIVPMLTTSSNL